MKYLPAAKKKANVVSLFKKGNPLDPNNFRPISLLCSEYKIFAGIIQMRLAAAMDHEVSEQQYAFRRGRSTAEPLAAIRRIADLAESIKQPVCMCFLDWSKAFDSIAPESLVRALVLTGWLQ